MKRKKIIKFCFTLVVLLIYVIPFIYVGSFVFPAADDYCRATVSFDTFLPNVASWYLEHNGRYTNAVLSFLPVYDLSIYRLMLMISIIALGWTIIYFVKKTFQFFGRRISRIDVALVGIAFYVVLISQLSSVYEFFYWYAATTVYLYSVIFFLLLLTRLYKLYIKDYFDGLAALLIVLLIGNNEMFILLSNFLLIGLLSYKLKEKQNFKNILLLNIVAWIATLAVVFAPGSINRQSYFSEGGNFLFSLKSAILSTGMFGLKGLVEWPYILVYISFFLLLVSLYKEGKKTELKSFNPVVLFLLSFIAISSVIFVPYYAQGTISLNEGRIGNIVHIVFLILLFINIINITFFLQKNQVLNNCSFLKANSALGLIFLFLILLPLVNQNYNNLFSDLKTNALVDYENQMVKITEQLKSAEEEVVLEELTETKLLRNLENRLNGCYVEVMNDKYHLNLKKIINTYRSENN